MLILLFCVEEGKQTSARVFILHIKKVWCNNDGLISGKRNVGWNRNKAKSFPSIPNWWKTFPLFHKMLMKKVMFPWKRKKRHSVFKIDSPASAFGGFFISIFFTSSENHGTHRNSLSQWERFSVSFVGSLSLCCWQEITWFLSHHDESVIRSLLSDERAFFGVEICRKVRIFKV